MPKRQVVYPSRTRRKAADVSNKKYVFALLIIRIQRPVPVQKFYVK